MEKKYVILIILCVIILIVGLNHFGFLNNHNNQFKVGDSTFILPNGFYEGTDNMYGDKNITNGSYSIFIVEFNETNLDDCINPYKKYMEEDKNRTITLVNYTIDGMPVYESRYNNSCTNHYWFVKNEKIYSIYAWQDNDNLHNLVNELIISTKLNHN